MRSSWAVLPVLLLVGCSSAPPRPEAPKPKRPAQAPAQFRVKFDTSEGPFSVEVVREWAPRGADRFHELVEERFFDEARFFRVVKGFIVQFGIAGNPQVQARWRELRIVDDPVKQSNKRGTLSFAKREANTRSTQVFINLKDNSKMLDGTGFAPFGRVVEGMETVEKLYAGYGDTPPMGYYGPDMTKVEVEGNGYLERSFPKLDFIRTARVE